MARSTSRQWSDVVYDRADYDELDLAELYFDQSDGVTLTRTEEGRVLFEFEELEDAAEAELVLVPIGEDLLCSCTCRTSQQKVACGHLIVAIHLLEDLDLLSEGGTIDNDRLSLIPRGSAAAQPHPDWWKLLRRGKAIRLPGMEVQNQLQAQPKPRLPWKPIFKVLRAESEPNRERFAEPWPSDRELLYAINVPQTMDGTGLVVETLSREKKKDGTWKKPVRAGMGIDMLAKLPDPADREIVALLSGARGTNPYVSAGESVSQRVLASAHARALLPRLCATGRLYFRMSEDDLITEPALRWDGGPPWQFILDFHTDEAKEYLVIEGRLTRGEQSIPLETPLMLTSEGHVYFTNGTVAEFTHDGAFNWIVALRSQRQIRVPIQEAEELMGELYTVPQLPKIRAPEDFTVKEIALPMEPQLRLKPPPKRDYPVYETNKLIAEVTFAYGDHAAQPHTGDVIFDKATRTVIRRDRSAEAHAYARLVGMGFRDQYDYRSGTTSLMISNKAVPQVVRTLMAEGWRVEAEGKLYRVAREITVDVTSGIDWFDLNVKADFGGVSASLPRLLEALRKGEKIVRLDDGTFGMLPEEWLKKYAPLAGAGTAEKDAVRFTRAQAGLLDALLMAQPQANIDETFRRTRDELRRFGGITPADPPSTFTGELRPYQRDALGWFKFLRQFGFGGCLADDMGLGKTVQVLAMLEERRVKANGSPRASLVVVPRSLVFNWKQEAAKFTPNLRVLDHTGTAREKSIAPFARHDLVLTTYGTLRNDMLFLKDYEFDYVVLDEAQAVKNSASESAKAVRLLRGEHRLCLSGTPVQNHLGELWSLFDFLNPGLLGRASVFNSTASKNPDPETREMLSRGLRPFILRRTKEQVARDLPEKLEQTLFCDLDKDQRKLYNELRDHYRSHLLGMIAEKGIAKSRFMVLEALLRLRQAACHPGLIDPKLTDDSSAKLDTLLPRLEEVVAEGHKALVFSQFTSFLALVRKQLDKDKVCYEYLDGKTRDRQAKVDRFQSDSKCKLFLISLKAGGVGLNLTAADYVFLLDPWWNPAVEAQAIDRTHRIGQTRKVFATRLIARDTVEEKVLALQQTKRALADAIINADNSLIRSLGKEDLELLLS